MGESGGTTEREKETSMKPIAPASPSRGIHGTIHSRSRSALLLATALAAPLGLEPRAVAQTVHETQMA